MISTLEFLASVLIVVSLTMQNTLTFGTFVAVLSIIETNKMDAIIRMYFHNRHRKNQK
jgi:hypothetical protein